MARTVSEREPDSFGCVFLLFFSYVCEASEEQPNIDPARLAEEILRLQHGKTREARRARSERESEFVSASRRRGIPLAIQARRKTVGKIKVSEEQIANFE